MAVQDSNGRWWSPDRRYWWDGTRWNLLSPPPGGMPTELAIALSGLIGGAFLVMFGSTIGPVNAIVVQRLFGDGWSPPIGSAMTPPLAYVVLLLVCTVLAFALAWFGGRLARGKLREGDRLTDRGRAMLCCTWFATATLTWACVVMGLLLLSPILPSFARWALASAVLSPLVPITLIVADVIFGIITVGLGVGPPQVAGQVLQARQRSGGGMGSSDFGSSSGDGDWGKAILLLIIVVVSASLAILTVWLIARASARRAGVSLSLTSTYLGPPRPTPGSPGASPAMA